MSLSKKERDGMKDALAFLNGITFTEDEDEFMAGSGLGGICLDLGRCLDDLGEKEKEIKELNQKVKGQRNQIVELEVVIHCQQLRIEKVTK